MGTRGTVEFFTSKDLYDSEKLLCTVYQHFDMYLEGFKEKLLAAINYQFNNNNKQLVISFISANTDSEITSSTAWHGDLEYVYKIFGEDNKATISVYKKNFNDDSWNKIVDNQTLESFLNT